MRGRCRLTAKRRTRPARWFRCASTAPLKTSAPTSACSAAPGRRADRRATSSSPGTETSVSQTFVFDGEGRRQPALFFCTRGPALRGRIRELRRKQRAGERKERTLRRFHAELTESRG